MDERPYTKRCWSCRGAGLTFSKRDLARWEEEWEWETLLACSLCGATIPRSRVVGAVQYYFERPD